MTFTIQLQTNRGTFMMNRHDLHQPHSIVRTGRPHIDDEIEALLSLADRLPDGALVIDAGANIGLISIPIARHLKDRGGRVVAFEPQRLIYYMLAGNAVHAGLANLYCHQMALTSEPGTMIVPERDPERTQDFGQVSLLTEEQHGITIQAVPIDDLPLDRLDLMKIDVEGMELDLLEGAVETIKKFRPLIWIEIWPANYASVGGWLKDRDYVIFIYNALNFIAVPIEKSGELSGEFHEFNGTDNPMYDAIYGSP